MFNAYLIWYIVTEILFIITIIVWPNLYFDLPDQSFSNSDIKAFREDFVYSVIFSLSPIFRELLIIHGIIYWFVAKRFPLK